MPSKSIDGTNGSPIQQSLSLSNGSGVFTQTVGTTSPSYSLKWPSAQGAANTTLVNDGSGNLSFSSPSAANAFVQNGNSFGATATIGTKDNNPLVLETKGNAVLTLNTNQSATFASTVTLTNLIAQTNVQIGNGSLTGALYMDGQAGGELTLTVPNSFTSWALKFPGSQGANGSVMVNDSTGILTWKTPTQQGLFSNGLNSFGSSATLGTGDGNSLTIKTNNTTAITISTAQLATFASGASFTNATTSYVPGTLSYYEDKTSVSSTWTGAAGFTVSIIYVRIGNVVFCRIPAGSGTSLALGNLHSNGIVPARFWPPAGANFPIHILNGSAVPAGPGMLSVHANGDLVAYLDMTGGGANFASSGNSGFNDDVNVHWIV